jgi:2-polyprenyl-6-methoxyphenol hydroxylase-like FAD-dependent oxidoreductase
MESLVDTVIVGAGPTGLFIAIALARRGRHVTVVDRDAGPARAGAWNRKGVMQFHHAHAFRGPVVDSLRAEMPDVLDSLGAAGAEIEVGPDHRAIALLCRRSAFETALHEAARAEPNITMVVGHVDHVLRHRGRAAGLRIDGGELAADLIIDASGRSSRFTAPFRPSAEGGDCGASYLTRHYRLNPDRVGGARNSPTGLGLSFAGYWAIVFRQDSGTFSVLLSHDGTDRRLRRLRHDHVFDAVVRAIPDLSGWIHPDQSRPVSPVLPGGRLYNTYRGQLDDDGRPLLPGLISVGDAVCTTTPLAGRGVTLALWQAEHLVRSLDFRDVDIDSATVEFDRWCGEHIRPWFEDHRHADGDRLRRWAGGDIDPASRIPSDLIVMAAEKDSRIRRFTDPFSRMDAGPATLSPAEPMARAVYATGWRPSVPAGPCRAELGQLCVSATPPAAA